MNLFQIWASGSGDVLSKISYLELWWPSWSVEQNHLCNFEKGHHGEHSCEVLMKFGPVVQEDMLFKEKVYGCRTQTNHNTSP